MWKVLLNNHFMDLRLISRSDFKDIYSFCLVSEIKISPKAIIKPV
jgi:hypothetical protein